MGKVTITASVEFANEAEVTMATELLKTIQQLTSSFTTNLSDFQDKKQAAVDTFIGKSNVQQQIQSPRAAAPLATPAATAAATASSAIARAAPPATQAPKPLFAFAVALSEKEMEEVVQSLLVPAKQQAAITILDRSLEEFREKAFQQFFDCFLGVLFNPEPSKRPSNVEAFLKVLMELKDPWRDQARGPLTTKLLKLLTVKRSVDCDRRELMGHAEAFAVMVKFEVIAINAAATTLARLIKKPENRAAAITTLGKTVELCEEGLTQLGPGQVEELRAALLQVSEPVFSYDIQFIRENFSALKLPATTQVEAPVSAPAPTPAAVHVGPTGPVVDPSARFKVVVTESMQGHSAAIFSVNVDESAGTVVSAARDGVTLVWSLDGRILDRLQLDRHYVCAADLNPACATMLFSAVARDPPPPAGAPPPPRPTVDPALFVYRRQANGRWQLKGTKVCSKAKIVACVKSVGGAANRFATGEQLVEPGPDRRRDCVCLYDLDVPSGPDMPPTVTYWEHEELVTCLSACPGFGAGEPSQLFFSGSKDKTIRLYDPRAPQSVGLVQSAQVAGPGCGHANMITCLDTLPGAAAPTLVSAGMEPRLFVWDVRKLARPQTLLDVGSTAILRIAACSGGSGQVGPGLVAVSSVRGLFVVRLSDASVERVELPALRPTVQPYHDVKWAAGALWAGGEDRTIDRFEVQAL